MQRVQTDEPLLCYILYSDMLPTLDLIESSQKESREQMLSALDNEKLSWTGFKLLAVHQRREHWDMIHRPSLAGERAERIHSHAEYDALSHRSKRADHNTSFFSRDRGSHNGAFLPINPDLFITDIAGKT